MTGDLHLLRRLGQHLDFRPHGLKWADRTEESNPYLIAPTLRDELISQSLRIRDKNGALAVLNLNRAQAEYSRTCTQRNIVLKARQLGITTYLAARLFVQTITHPGTVTVQVAHNQESAEEIFRIVHRFWGNLPKAARCSALVTSRANVRQIVFPRLDSEYRVATAADVNAGRGLTIHNLHCSEVARWPRVGEETLISLRAAVPPAGEIVLESTPNGAGGLFYDEWQRADETGYRRHFFPWWYEDSYAIAGDEELFPLAPEEQELAKRWGLTNAQLAFRRTIRSTLRGLAVQEYAENPVSCFKASGECVFDIETIEQRLQSCDEPVEVHDNGRLTIWWPVQTLRQYIVGVDPAGGGCEGDYACAEVIDRMTGTQCAELHGHFPLRELATKVAELARLYNQALVAVERNNHGYGVLAYLRSSELRPNIYEQNGKEGWLTSAASRPAMIENLAAVLATNPEVFQSPRLLNECRTFVRRADGNSGAVAGAHDDCVMATGIALAVRESIAGELARRGKMELCSLS